MKKVLLTTVTLFALSANANFNSSSHNWNMGSDPFKATISAAESIYKEVEKVNGWRDTAKLIKDAKAAQAKGDSVTALKLAKVAHNQAVRAKEQIPAMQNAGPRF